MRRTNNAAPQQHTEEVCTTPTDGIRRGDPHYSRAVLAMLATGLASFNALYCTQAMLPTFTTALGITPTTAALTVSATTGALALSVVPASILSERFGRGRILIGSVLLACLIGWISPFAPNAGLLIALRTAQGIALAGVPAVAMTWLCEELHPSALPQAMGLYIAGTSLGGLIGRIIPAGVLEIASWRWALGADIAVASAFALAILFLLPQQKQFIPKRLTLGGELRAMLSHLTNPRLAALYMVAFLAMGAFVSLYNYIGFRMIERFHLSEALIGALFLMYLSGTWSSAKAGHMAGRHGRSRVLAVMSALSIVGAAATFSPHLAVTVLGILIFTAAFFAIHSVASGWIGALATHDRAEASSMYLFFYYMGSSIVGWGSGIVLHHAGWASFVTWICGLSAITLLLAIGLMMAVKDRTTSKPTTLSPSSASS